MRFISGMRSAVAPHSHKIRGTGIMKQLGSTTCLSQTIQNLIFLYPMNHSLTSPFPFILSSPPSFTLRSSLSGVPYFKDKAHYRSGAVKTARCFGAPRGHSKIRISGDWRAAGTGFGAWDSPCRGFSIAKIRRTWQFQSRQSSHPVDIREK